MVAATASPGKNPSYGVYNVSGGTFNFYDGIISSTYGADSAIYGTVSNTPTGYSVLKTVTTDGETAVLEAAYNYMIVENNNTYDVLNDAFSAISNNQTIRVLKNVTETTSATLASGKTGITLDLNGKTITSSTNPLLTNNGGLTITSLNENGVINSSGTNTIVNGGTLHVNGSSSSNKVTINNTGSSESNIVLKNNSGGTAYLESNSTLQFTTGQEDDYRYVVDNSGTLNIDGASLLSASGATADGGVYNRSTVNMSSGVINVTGEYGGGIVGVSNSVTNIAGGTVSSYDGAVTGNGTLNVTGGTIRGNSSVGISINGTVTLGTNDGNVSTTSPVIESVGNNAVSGISGSGTLNFYDGIVKSSKGTGYAINSNVTVVPATNHMVQKELDEGVEKAYLVFKNVLMTATYGNGTANFLRTNVVKSNIETITFTNSIGSHTVNGTNCFDVSRDENESVLAWVTDNDNDGLKEITIGANGNIFAESGYYLLSFLTNVTQINGLEYLDTSEVTTMEGMFSGSSKITSLDLGDFNTSSVTNMNSMFKDCSLLNAVYVTNSFVVTSVTNSTNMFANCTNIEGGAGTTYNSSYIDKTRAKIDGGTSDPGYFIQRVQYTATLMKGSHVTAIGSGSARCTLLRGNTSCSILLPSITAETNYSPVGWSTTNGDTTGSAALTLYSISSNTTLYGNARGKEITVTFNAGPNAYGLTYNTNTVYYNETYGELPSVNSSNYCEDYQFDGWYTSHTSNGNGSGSRVQTTTQVTETEDHTLYTRMSWTGYVMGYCTSGGTYNYSSGKCVANRGASYNMSECENNGCYYSMMCNSNGWWTYEGPGTDHSCDDGYTKHPTCATEPQVSCFALDPPLTAGQYYTVYCTATCDWNGDYTPSSYYCGW